MGNGNRTRNRRSHSPVLCQLSYSHRRLHYSNFDDTTALRRCRNRAAVARVEFRTELVSDLNTALCKTFDFRVTDDLYSKFFAAYSGKRWPGCYAAHFRTPRGPAQIPRETAGGTSEGGRSCGFPGRPRAGARGGSDHSSAKKRVHHAVNR